MQRFNNENLESKFIKNIIQNIYLPTLPIVKDGDLIVSGVEYCYKNQLIRCDRTGVLNNVGTVSGGITYVERNAYNPDKDLSRYTPTCSPHAVCSGDPEVKDDGFICGVGIGRAVYDVIEKIPSYEFRPGLNYKYKSHTPRYDNNTHRHLGNYLRWYRDTHNIDLMSLYNCFCGETYTLAHIDGDELKDGYDGTKSVHIVPIQLNQRYTLFVNSQHKVSICGAFLNNNGRVLNPLKEDGKEYVDEYLDDTVQHYDSSTYSTPIIYETYTTDSKVVSYSNQFYLIVQTDDSYFCPIVVLEGDYRKAPNRIINSAESYAYDSSVSIDYGLFNPKINPSIVISPTSYYVPYSPRLIEFLTESAITRTEDIPHNIGRIQYELNFRTPSGDLTDVWDDKLRYVIYNNYFRYTDKNYFKASQLDSNYMPTEEAMSTKSIPENLKIYDGNKLIGLKNCKLRQTFETKYDITGYVDKDIEDSIYKYRSV